MITWFFYLIVRGNGQRKRKERAIILGEDNVDKHKQENKRGEPSKKRKQKSSLLGRSIPPPIVSWPPGAEV